MHFGGTIRPELPCIIFPKSNNNDSLSPKHQLAHANQVLGNLGEALLALVLDEARPELEIPVDLDESFLVVLGQTDLLPQPVWKGRPLNGLHIQVAHTYNRKIIRILING